MVDSYIEENRNCSPIGRLAKLPSEQSCILPSIGSFPQVTSFDDYTTSLYEL